MAKSISDRMIWKNPIGISAKGSFAETVRQMGVIITPSVFSTPDGASITPRPIFFLKLCALYRSIRSFRLPLLFGISSTVRYEDEFVQHTDTTISAKSSTRLLWLNIIWIEAEPRGWCVCPHARDMLWKAVCHRCLNLHCHAVIHSGIMNCVFTLCIIDFETTLSRQTRKTLCMYAQWFMSFCIIQYWV